MNPAGSHSRAGAAAFGRVISHAAALAAVAALAAIAHELTERAPSDAASAVATATAALGFLLMGGWLAGRLASQVGLPALTGQLLAGMCAGPSVAGALAPAAAKFGLASIPTLVSSQDIGYLAGLDALAVSMIGIAAGGELELNHLRRIAKRVLSIVVVEMPAVGLAAGGALALAASSGLAAFGQDVPMPLVCTLTGCLMMASSPAVAIALTREHGRTGSFAQFAMALIVAKDIVLTVLFTGVLVAGARLAGAPEGTDAGPEASGAGVTLAWHLLGSLVLGAMLSAPLALVLGRIERRLDMVALVVAALVAAVSRSLDLSAAGRAHHGDRAPHRRAIQQPRLLLSDGAHPAAGLLHLLRAHWREARRRVDLVGAAGHCGDLRRAHGRRVGRRDGRGRDGRARAAHPPLDLGMPGSAGWRRDRARLRGGHGVRGQRVGRAADGAAHLVRRVQRDRRPAAHAHCAAARAVSGAALWRAQ